MEAELRAALDLAVKMRQAQRQYFADRSPANLSISKALEREFDAVVKKLLNPQGDLLG